MSNNWIDIKIELPTNNLVVEVQGNDISGNYTMQAKYVLYKKPKSKKGRWMHFIVLTEQYGYWDRYHKQEEIECWRNL